MALDSSLVGSEAIYHGSGALPASCRFALVFGLLLRPRTEGVHGHVHYGGSAVQHGEWARVDSVAVWVVVLAGHDK